MRSDLNLGLRQALVGRKPGSFSAVQPASEHLEALASLGQLAGGTFFSSAGLVLLLQIIHLGLLILDLFPSLVQAFHSTLNGFLLCIYPFLDLLQVRFKIVVPSAVLAAVRCSVLPPVPVLPPAYWKPYRPDDGLPRATYAHRPG